MGIPTRYNPLGIRKDDGGMPKEGLVFYMPMTSMNEFEAADPNVTTENWDGSYPVEFTTRYELKCSHFYTTPYRGIKIDHIENCFPFDGTPRTVSFWFSSDNINFSGMRTIMQHQYQDYRAGSSYTLSFMDNGLMIIAYANSADTITQGVYSQSKPNNSGWHNFCITSYNNENGLLQGEVYLDGSLAYQGHGGAAMNTVHRWSYAVIGGYSYQSLWNRTLDGYMAGLRIYNRVLTQEEVTRLATEYTPQYTITANDLNCNFYQKNETFGITYSSSMTPTFEIIEGSLPNTITFNTTNGQFSGKGLTDDDHIYNLKVRITAAQSTPAECNVTIHTYKTARISITGKTFTFYTDESENSTFEYTSDEAVTFAVDSGSLPNGITMNGNTFYSDGTTTAGSYSVVVRGTSEHNQTGVTATMNFTINANVITIDTSSLKFFVDRGATTKQIKYVTSNHSITPVYSMTGTLPTGVTFDASTGTFTNDATQTAATSGTVSVTVSSSTGRSTSATKNVDIVIEMTGEDPIIEDGLTFYMPCHNDRNAEYGQTVPLVAGNEPTYATVDGVPCMQLDGTQSFGDDNTPTYISRDTTYSSIPIFTYSLWFKGNSATTNGSRLGVIGKGWNMSTNGANTLYCYDGTIYQIMQGHWESIIEGNANKWHHFAMVVEAIGTNTYLHTYVDGIDKGGQNRGRWYYFNQGNFFSFPNAYGNDGQLHGDYSLTCCMAGLRIYNRVLTQSEIQQLAAEFTPTDG